MKHRAHLAILLALLAPLPAEAGEMRAEVRLDRANPRALRSLFGTYGLQPRQSVVLESGGFRFRLAGSGAGGGQVGVYSLFVLAGDCQATAAYELLRAPRPAKGYGSGVGLAFDAGETIGRGSIQRIVKPSGETGYVLQTVLGAGEKQREEYRFVSVTAKRGQIALRRVGKELVFLAAESLTAPPQEIGRLPFTDGTVRAVRLFGDVGGATTSLDARLYLQEARAEEVTGGVPAKEQTSSRGWWLAGAAVAVVAGGLGWWWRRARGPDSAER